MSSVKAWGNWNECLADHAMFLQQWPWIFGSYIGPNALEPEITEAVMVSVNSVFSCAFCTGLHCELARTAGVAEPKKLNCAQSVDECKKLVDKKSHAAVTYARAFGACDGRGEAESEAFKALAAAYGPGRAGSVRALSWFLLWGSWTGNTLNGLVGGSNRSPKPGSSMGFLVGLMLWYCVLFFGVINLVNLLVKVFPPLPTWASAIFGAVLTIVAGIWFIPLGAIGLLVGAQPSAGKKE